MSSSFRRKIGVLLVATVLLAPWAAAAEPGARNDSQNQTAWSLLAQLWSAVAGLWGDNGCSMDPYGSCRDGSTLPPPPENLENGCHMDPYGGCQPGS
jgi:hypothetical protein